MTKINFIDMKDTRNLLQCPCCGYFTLEERGGNEICTICFWEDDRVDLSNLDEISGPNPITLREGRNNFINYGACDINMKKYVLPVYERKNFKYKTII